MRGADHARRMLAVHQRAAHATGDDRGPERAGAGDQEPPAGPLRARRGGCGAGRAAVAGPAAARTGTSHGGLDGSRLSGGCIRRGGPDGTAFGMAADDWRRTTGVVGRRPRDPDPAGPPANRDRRSGQEGEEAPQDGQASPDGECRDQDRERLEDQRLLVRGEGRHEPEGDEDPRAGLEPPGGDDARDQGDQQGADQDREVEHQLVVRAEQRHHQVLGAGGLQGDDQGSHGRDQGRRIPDQAGQELADGDRHGPRQGTGNGRRPGFVPASEQARADCPSVGGAGSAAARSVGELGRASHGGHRSAPM